MNTILIPFVADSYETSDMLMEWDKEHAVELDDDLELPQFRLVDTTTSHCVKRYKIGATLGKFVRVFNRKIALFIITVFSYFYGWSMFVISRLHALHCSSVLCVSE